MNTHVLFKTFADSALEKGGGLTFDPVGNRTSSLGVSPYSYNSSNELTGQSGNVTYTYDNNGNLLTKTVGTSVTSYGWDFENRLTSVMLPGTGGTVTFKYDPFGRRIYKSSSSGTSIYAYDGDNQVEETDANGNPVARYVQGLGIDEPLVILRAGVTSYYHEDGLGSVNALSQINGSYDEIYKYDSFGVRLSYDGNVINPFQYTAREFDMETSLLYYRARYYDTSVGRFISEDPVRYLGGPNFYAYAQNNTPGLADPLGLFPVCVWVGSSEVASWETATRRYLTPWTFAFATQAEGGPDLESGVYLAVLHCVWKRTYVRQVWQNIIYLNTYLCVDPDACVSPVWLKFSLDTKKNFVGEIPGGTETTTTSRKLSGYDNEFLDWVYCRGIPP
jgi:RHS repeat-associated protein